MSNIESAEPISADIRVLMYTSSIEVHIQLTELFDIHIKTLFREGTYLTIVVNLSYAPQTITIATTHTRKY